MYLPVVLLPFFSKYISLKIQILCALTIGIAATWISIFNVNHVTVMLTLLFIGIFWSLSYASGSALLTKSYTADERQSARGKGELFPVLGLALGSLTAGPFSEYINWSAQMFFVLMFIFLTMIMVMIDWKKI
ncbi:hypothetical protein [Leuconostoc gasicomitatum]|nr:hypothetical protein [Leuconostoc gasicomitatum]